jgi:hypothetical protein
VAGQSFTAVSVGWTSTIAPARGRADVYVDGVKTATVETYAAGTTPRRIVFTKSGLTGQHDMEVRVLGRKATAATSTRVDVDAFALLVAVP